MCASDRKMLQFHMMLFFSKDNLKQIYYINIDIIFQVYDLMGLGKSVLKVSNSFKLLSSNVKVNIKSSVNIILI